MAIGRVSDRVEEQTSASFFDCFLLVDLKCWCQMAAAQSSLCSFILKDWQQNSVFVDYSQEYTVILLVLNESWFFLQLLLLFHRPFSIIVLKWKSLYQISKSKHSSWNHEHYNNRSLSSFLSQYKSYVLLLYSHMMFSKKIFYHLVILWFRHSYCNIFYERICDCNVKATRKYPCRTMKCSIWC